MVARIPPSLAVFLSADTSLGVPRSGKNGYAESELHLRQRRKIPGYAEHRLWHVKAVPMG